MSRGQNPSIRMVADRAGVSVATVSNVLNGKPSVSAEFAERVNSAVDELGYVVDIAASRLRSRKSQLAAVLVPDLTNPMFATFVSTLEHLARVDGFDLVVVSARNDVGEEADRLSRLRSWRPAGLIAIPCDGALAQRLPAGFNAPIVVADRIPDDPTFDLIAVDNGPSAGAIVTHLERQGYRDCLVIGTTLDISNVRERWEGAVAAAEAIGIELMEIGIDDPDGAGVLETRLRTNPPRALFSLDHGTTLTAYRMLKEIGLSVPDGIAFASFDDMEWMRLVSPGITAIRQPVEQMAEQAWALLTHQIEGKSGDHVTRRLRCALEIRGSTPRCPQDAAGESATGGNQCTLQDERS